MNITDDIAYVGVNDHDIDLFEGQYDVSAHGMSYNSYVIFDEKIAVTDTVDIRFRDEWLGNIKRTLGARKPDYLIVHHMEPDHSANIQVFMDEFPEAQIVASFAAFKMMQGYFGTDFADRKIVVKDGSELDLGTRTLTFISAPLVHWPEVMFSFDSKSRTLFSADAFGKFGANDYEDPDGWAPEARRYYFGIVGKFGTNVQAVIKKLDGFDIQRICSLHGPVLDENLGYYLNLYQTWSSYEPEAEGVCIAYTSVYGHTKAAVEELAQALRDRGAVVTVHDLARDDMSYAMECAYRYDKLVLATTTYCGGIFPFMETFLNTLVHHNYQKRTVGLIENGSWMPQAAKGMTAFLEQLKDLTIVEPVVSIKGSMDDANHQQIQALADALMA
ncbi:MAG: FprA family A-type flavoprotein [Eggerthellaceae bacterium]|jgi:flavorubredoxin